LRIADAAEEKKPEVPGNRLSTKLVVLLGQRWTAWSSRRRNDGRELECIHAAARQRFVWRAQEPGAVVTVLNQVRGDHGPLAAILWSGLLAIPELRFRDVHSGLRKPVFIE
jgi:hypothetical protein